MSEEVNEGVGLFTDDLFPWMQLGMGGGEPELDTAGNAEMQKWGGGGDYSRNQSVAQNH